jgi:DNA-binding MarR family transcriptional regulator
MKAEETVDFHLRRTWQSLMKYYNDVAAGYGVSMATGFVLLTIDKEAGTPATALGPKMGMESTSLSRLLRSMEEKGLIQRRPNPEDGRGVLVFLTEFGRDKREDAKGAVLQLNNFLYDYFPAEKVHTVLEVLEEIHQLAQNGAIPKFEANTLKTNEI